MVCWDRGGKETSHILVSVDEICESVQELSGLTPLEAVAVVPVVPQPQPVRQGKNLPMGDIHHHFQGQGFTATFLRSAASGLDYGGSLVHCEVHVSKEIVVIDGGF